MKGKSDNALTRIPTGERSPSVRLKWVFYCGDG